MFMIDTGPDAQDLGCSATTPVGTIAFTFRQVTIRRMARFGVVSQPGLSHYSKSATTPIMILSTASLLFNI